MGFQGTKKNARLRFPAVERRVRAGETTMTALRLLVAMLAAGLVANAEAVRTPQQLYGPLYRAVEEAHLFLDSKEFADALPKASPDAIMTDWRQSAPQTSAALKSFVADHFTMPEQTTVPNGPSDTRPLSLHIDTLWSHLVRRTPTAPPNSSLLPLPYPYVVPGGRFREIYYWDSYFTMLGLVESGRQDLVRDMVRNFAHMIDAYGHIPNGSRTYYLSRSQPPFFFAMVGLVDPDDPAKGYAQYLPQLKAEYRYWMRGAINLKPGEARERVVALSDGTILNRYWDDSDTPRDESFREDEQLARASLRPHNEIYRNARAAAESGWDFTARWFGDGKTLTSIVTTEIVPVDLNSLIFGLEDAIHLGCERVRDTACAHEYADRAAKRRNAINTYLWDDKLGAYGDWRWTQKRFTGILSVATFYPLFFGVANADRAASVAEAGRKSLLRPGGLVSTPITTGEQWDAPNGWAPLQWMAVGGLRRYHNDLAAVISCRWIVNVNAVYRRTGKLVEKYDVVTPNRPGGGGEYKLQDGFGWTNGVTRKLMTVYPAYARFTAADRCPAP
jgi:alpha,alpha-trehalase